MPAHCSAKAVEGEFLFPVTAIIFCGYLPYSVQGTELLSKPCSSLSEVSLAGTEFNSEAVSEKKARTLFSTSKVCKMCATTVFRDL